eukprot:CAMPEP_0194393308 /NCGR_PEP_ID=MMETSP0174-20130528/123226_1 /TAXON_ID=216777 /ORGANISM="Proboscia alata, Strain PI-D3" /LENGTH=213 /DNA_ID=CAMNT_0039188977 /DNA_START=122 /DNA_END=763 /DNA_ORIENTATION=-
MVLTPFHHHKHRLKHRVADRKRRLDDSYLVDSDGTAYTSYSLAWRYLGMFIDCDNDNDNNNNNRRLSSDSGDGDGSCTRKVLWAAYHYPEYHGGSIGEYQFYDRTNQRWDSSTCQSQTSKWDVFHRGCQRMDCHEANSNFELVGVFTETDGLYDWTEQLFKHHGYCLWDGDKEEDDENSGDQQNGNDQNENQNQYSDYNFMQNLQENFVYGCT